MGGPTGSRYRLPRNPKEKEIKEDDVLREADVLLEHNKGNRLSNRIGLL